jgi:hypothetical protein
MPATIDVAFPSTQTQHLCLLFPQAVLAELGSKEGRVTNKTMARLLQHLLSRNPIATQRGWVLDGWPRTAAQARLASHVVVPIEGCPAGAVAAAGGDEAPRNRRESQAGAAKVKCLASCVIKILVYLE